MMALLEGEKISNMLPLYIQGYGSTDEVPREVQPQIIILPSTWDSFSPSMIVTWGLMLVLGVVVLLGARQAKAFASTSEILFLGFKQTRHV
mmetsp:Transcript_1544/g.2274  ORF Transcript_1544/g.2274 Transcript_1544/m.2274 type:complete len:91 (-) Transcript_1544:460-732(-)